MEREFLVWVEKNNINKDDVNIDLLYKCWLSGSTSYVGRVKAINSVISAVERKGSNKNKELILWLENIKNIFKNK